MPNCGYISATDKRTWVHRASEISGYELKWENTPTKGILESAIRVWAERNNVILLTTAEYDIVDDLTASLEECRALREFLEVRGVFTERSWRTTVRKARADIVYPSSGGIGDLKTSSKLITAKSIAEGPWAKQPAYYVDVMRTCGLNATMDYWFWFVIQINEIVRLTPTGRKRYKIRFFEASKELIAKAKDDLQMAKERLSKAMSTGDFGKDPYPEFYTVYPTYKDIEK